MADVVESLARVPLFARLEKKDREQLAKLLKKRTFTEGQTATEEGRGGAAFWVIEEGEATVSVKGRIVRTLGPGDYFGEIALLDEGVRSATVTAATDMRCHGMSPWEFRGFVDQSHDAAWALLQGLAIRLREAESREEEA